MQIIDEIKTSLLNKRFNQIIKESYGKKRLSNELINTANQCKKPAAKTTGSITVVNMRKHNERHEFI